jgi:hypothetical protein
MAWPAASNKMNGKYGFVRRQVFVNFKVLYWLHASFTTDSNLLKIRYDLFNYAVSSHGYTALDQRTINA